MTQKLRRRLFYLALAVFVLLGSGAVVLALGYRYDFIQNKLVKTGSFRIKTNTPADVYINDRLAGKTSFLSDTFTKSFLLPRTYSVRVQSENYLSWPKNIEIGAGMFADFSRVVILPQKLQEEIIASVSFKPALIKFESDKNLVILSAGQRSVAVDLKSGIQKIDKEKIIQAAVTGRTGVKSPDGAKLLTFNSHEIWVEWLNDAGYQPFKRNGDKELVTRFSQPVLDVQWYKDSDHLFANVGGILKFMEIDARGGSINIFDIATIQNKFYYDKNTDAVYKVDGNKVIKISLK